MAMHVKILKNRPKKFLNGLNDVRGRPPSERNIFEYEMTQSRPN